MNLTAPESYIFCQDFHQNWPRLWFYQCYTRKMCTGFEAPIPKLSLGSRFLWMGDMNVTLCLLQKCILVFCSQNCIVGSMDGVCDPFFQSLALALGVCL